MIKEVTTMKLCNSDLNQFVMFQAQNKQVSYFFMDYNSAKNLADNLPEGRVLGLDSHDNWQEIELD